MQAMSADAEAEEEAVLSLQLAFRCRVARHILRQLAAESRAAVCIQSACRARVARRVMRARLREEEDRRLQAEAERLAALSPTGSNSSRASRSTQGSRGSRKEGVSPSQSRPATGGQFFAHPLTPMQGDPTASPGLSEMERTASRRGQRSRPGTQTSVPGTEGLPRSASGTASSMKRMEFVSVMDFPGTTPSTAYMHPGTAPGTAGMLTLFVKRDLISCRKRTNSVKRDLIMSRNDSKSI
jgi:hypothetical protein